MVFVVSETALNFIMMGIWLGIFIVSIILEAESAQVVSVWFAIGAVFALIFTFIPKIPFYVEIIVFFGISILCLILFRPLVKKMLMKGMPKEEFENIVGKRGQVVSEIKDDRLIEVKIDGIIWRALTGDNEKYEIDDFVVVKDIKGNKLIIEKEGK